MGSGRATLILWHLNRDWGMERLSPVAPWERRFQVAMVPWDGDMWGMSGHHEKVSKAGIQWRWRKEVGDEVISGARFGFLQSLHGQGKFMGSPVCCQIPLMSVAAAYGPSLLLPSDPQVGWFQWWVSFTAWLRKPEVAANKAQKDRAGSQVLIPCLLVVPVGLPHCCSSL